MSLHKSIAYHTRLVSDNTRKIVGGSFGGAIDEETVDRLVKSHFKVHIKAEGRGVFVDKDGREVSLYLSVDPCNTVQGRIALAEYRAEQRKKAQAEEDLEKEIDTLLSGMTQEEVLRRLRGD